MRRMKIAGGAGFFGGTDLIISIVTNFLTDQFQTFVWLCPNT